MKPRVVIIVRGGVVQGIIGEREDDVDVMLKDYDCEGAPDEDTKEDSEGDRYCYGLGPYSFDPEYVEESFNELEGS